MDAVGTAPPVNMFFNMLGYEAFISEFGNIVEHCPVLAAAVWSHRPFNQPQDLAETFEKVIDTLPVEVKEGILRCHPDLAGRLAQTDQLTDESKQEQAAAGLDKMTDNERLALQLSNNRYKTKFGFPFVICARHNKKEAILKGIELRLQNDRDNEVKQGIIEVKKIARLRLDQIIQKHKSAL